MLRYVLLAHEMATRKIDRVFCTLCYGAAHFLVNFSKVRCEGLPEEEHHITESLPEGRARGVELVTHNTS